MTLHLRHLVAATLLAAGCNPGSPPVFIRDGGTKDMATPTDAPPGGGGDLAARFMEVNGCKMADYADFTQGMFPTITFPVDATPAQYQPNCVKVKPFTTVRWTGGFGFHPLGPSGGDMPNPVTGMPAVTFPNPGIFGFDCIEHPDVMRGAVWVIP